MDAERLKNIGEKKARSEHVGTSGEGRSLDAVGAVGSLIGRANDAALLIDTGEAFIKRGPKGVSEKVDEALAIIPMHGPKGVSDVVEGFFATPVVLGLRLIRAARDAGPPVRDPDVPRPGGERRF